MAFAISDLIGIHTKVELDEKITSDEIKNIISELRECYEEVFKENRMLTELIRELEIELATHDMETISNPFDGLGKSYDFSQYDSVCQNCGMYRDDDNKCLSCGKQYFQAIQDMKANDAKHSN